MREIEKRVQLWDLEQHQELLSDREPNEAYVAANPGESYLVYLPDGGTVLSLR